MFERCFAETLAILLAHRRERAILLAGGLHAEVQHRQALARSASAAATVDEAVAEQAVDVLKRRQLAA